MVRLEAQLEKCTLEGVEHAEVPAAGAPIGVDFTLEIFRRLGGSSRTVVLDNLKEGVLKPDIYDPSLNPLYRDMPTLSTMASH